ncbi:hypothetical protein [Cochlodiniinecator piscidefendens]|uniref:hypothetical protein n=1 Tax=Cochlodiniinecator piscidefendens TaxID=2715756 RepID=UPI00140D211B|nr:hypothetical protein [Cochlodiniinecator piscidefendens]
MSTFLPKEVQAGLDAARKKALKKKTRLRIHNDDEIFPVLRIWEDGLALDAKNAPHLRGLVDIYDGARHLSQCLIVASDEENGEMVYEFKRNTAVADKAALDFAREEHAPVALISVLP